MGIITYQQDCASCGTRRVAFQGESVSYMRNREHLWVVFMTCQHCDAGLIVYVKDEHRRHESPAESASSVALGQAAGWKVVDWTPRLRQTAVPADTPEQVAKPFIEAADNLRQHNFETAGMLCRKALDIATKLLMPEAAPRMTLYNRITAMSDSGDITRDMAAWANAVRLDGNDVVHGATEADEAKAKDLLKFTEAFLTYAFTLPAMVHRRMNREIEELTG